MRNGEIINVYAHAPTDEARKAVRKLLFTRCVKTEINLRKYAILGGVCHVDLVHQPPQPKDMRRNIFVTTRKYMRAATSFELTSGPRIINANCLFFSTTSERARVCTFFETLQSPASGTGFRENTGSHRGGDEGPRSSDGSTRANHSQVGRLRQKKKGKKKASSNSCVVTWLLPPPPPQASGQRALVRATSGGPLASRGKDLVDAGRARHKIQRGEANNNI